MKRKAPGHLPPVLAVRLHLDDVRALYNETATVSGGARIETDEYELDGPDDLLNLGRDRISTLTLSSDDANVFVFIFRRGAVVRRLGNEAKDIVLAQTLREMLLERRRRLHWLAGWWGQLLGWVLLASGNIFVYLVGGRVGVIGGLAALFLAVPVFLGHVAMRLIFGGVVHLRERRDSRSFLKRNSDTLIVTGLVSLVTAVVSVLLTYYLTKK
jgi:hypothetical protein